MEENLQLLPYLTFDGKAKEAMAFYKEVFGGELTVQPFSAIYPDLAEADKDKLMHSALENDFMSLFASDTVPGSTTTFGDNVRITVTGTDVTKLGGYFEKLGKDGTVAMPFEKQVWGQELGMLTDQFGTHWLVSVRA